MKKNILKPILALSAAAILTVSAFTFMPTGTNVIAASQTENTSVSATNQAPKYVFLFIGDGMSYPQIQAASDYLGAKKQGNTPEILKGGENLSFMNFPAVGSATTFDSTSFCPDSASTATSISTGHKTYSSVINMDETKTISYGGRCRSPPA